MAPRTGSRHSFTIGLHDELGRRFLSEREPGAQISSADSGALGLHPELSPLPEVPSDDSLESSLLRSSNHILEVEQNLGTAVLNARDDYLEALEADPSARPPTVNMSFGTSVARIVHDTFGTDVATDPSDDQLVAWQEQNPNAFDELVDQANIDPALVEAWEAYKNGDESAREGALEFKKAFGRAYGEALLEVHQGRTDPETGRLLTDVVTDEVNEALESASAAGIVAVTSAGNYQDETEFFGLPPAASATFKEDLHNILVVGATDLGDETDGSQSSTDFSSALAPDFALPGSGGTSFASPIAAGLVAQIQAEREARGLPRRDANQLQEVLARSASDLSVDENGNGQIDPDEDRDGAGAVDPLLAVALGVAYDTERGGLTDDVVSEVKAQLLLEELGRILFPKSKNLADASGQRRPKHLEGLSTPAPRSAAGELSPARRHHSAIGSI